MTVDLDRIVRVNVATQGPPAAGLTVGEKTDILADIAASDALITGLQTDLDAAEATIVTLTADLAEARRGWLTLLYDGGGSVVGTGVRIRALVPFDCTITTDPVDTIAWRVGLDQSGSIGLELWQDTHANYPPTVADKISGTTTTQNPRVTTATSAQSGSLTGWTTALVGGRWLFVNVASITTATYFALGLYVVKS